MYHISCIDGDRWRIADASNRLVFVGTRQQSEDWLDCQENAQLRPAAFKAGLRKFFDACAPVLGRLMGQTPARV